MSSGKWWPFCLGLNVLTIKLPALYMTLVIASSADVQVANGTALKMKVLEVYFLILFSI